MNRIRRSRALIAILVALTASTAVGLPTFADLNLILGEPAVVAYTNGDGVNVRDAMGFGGNVISTLGEGVEVVVHDGPVAANDGSYWYYASSGEVEGWIIADYLALPGSQSGSSSTTGEVAFTGGDGVNLRSDMVDGTVLTTLREGAVVTIIAGPEWDGAGTPWTLVDFEGTEGWMVDDYLAWHDTSGGSGSEVQQVSDSWTAYVSGTGGGLRLRDASSYDANTLVVMPDSAAVTVLATEIYGADGTEWWNVEYEGIVGYSAAYYLTGDVPPTEEAAESESQEEPATEDTEEVVTNDGGDLNVWAGANAEVVTENGATLNLRYEAGYNSGVASTLDAGSIVWVIEGPVWGDDGSPWFQVDANGTTGWVHGDYLVYTEDAPDSSAEVSVADETPIEPEVASLGQQIVDEALNYVGLPYVWGGTTPSGFDCSGFTHYVLTAVFGENFSRSLQVQASSGYHVSQSELQAGDLVFFQNTYTWGLSHVGIYMGDGQFVHAGSERTGVTITSMSDEYWSSRYYTARRVAD